MAHYYTLVASTHLHFNIPDWNETNIKESVARMQGNITKTSTRQVGVSFGYDITKKVIDDLLALISRNTRIRRISLSLINDSPHAAFEQLTTDGKLSSSFIARNVPVIKHCLLLNTQLRELELNYCYLTRETWTSLVSMVNIHCPLLNKLWIMEDCHEIRFVVDITRLVVENKSITRLTCCPRASLTPDELDWGSLKMIEQNVSNNKTLQYFTMGLGTPTIKQYIETNTTPLANVCAALIKLTHMESLNGEYGLSYTVNHGRNYFTPKAVKGATHLTFSQVGEIHAKDKTSIMTFLRHTAKDTTNEHVPITAAEICSNCTTLVFRDMMTLSQWSPFDVILSCRNLKSLRILNCKLDELNPTQSTKKQHDDR